MSVKKIVLTGGPCAGKSIALKAVDEYYTGLGFKVITVPEGATALMLQGITYDSCNGADAFETRLLEYQLKKEAEAMSAALRYSGENVIVVCDRGAYDCRSYMSAEGYVSACEKAGVSNVRLRDSYDAVFHMVTAANGAREHYSYGGSSTRMENADEALAADEKLLQSWIGHPHLRVIGCRDDFRDKLNDLLAEISFFLGVPRPLEIERKYLIRYPDLKALDDDPFCHRVAISQTYLTDEQGGYRIRKRGEDGDFLYFLTRKRKISGISREEIEERISEQEYEEHLSRGSMPLKTVTKYRYCRIYKNRYFEIDVFPFWEDRALMEIELKSEDETAELPPDIEVIREVSSEKQYTNRAIAEALAKCQL